MCSACSLSEGGHFFEDPGCDQLGPGLGHVDPIGEPDVGVTDELTVPAAWIDSSAQVQDDDAAS